MTPSDTLLEKKAEIMLRLNNQFGLGDSDYDFLSVALDELMKASREEAKKEIEYNLRQIAEIYIGMDGFTPLTAPEAYQQMKLKEIYDEIQKLLAPKGE